LFPSAFFPLWLSESSTLFLLATVGVDGTDQKLDEIKRAISELNQKLDGISDQIKAFQVSTTTQFTTAAVARIETLYSDFATDLLVLAKYVNDRTSKSSGSDKTHYQKARDALTDTGKLIRAEVGTNLLTIHNLLVGEASAAGLLSLARAENLKNSKGFMNHYIYMRQVFLRYWAVSTKCITLLEWISSNGSGVDFVGWCERKAPGA
jgi:hypothetical protein